MAASDDEVQELVYVLTRISDNIHRAQSRILDPTRLAIIRAAATRSQVRPSEIAAELTVHQSSIARQTRALEDQGLVEVTADPADRRSCFIALTEAGWAEAKRLTVQGIAQFSQFIEDWTAEDVRELTAGLLRLERSVAAKKAGEQRSGGRRWQRGTGDPAE